jgi:hypothetical protein
MSKLAHEINAQITGEVKLKKMKYVAVDHHLAPPMISPPMISPTRMASKGVRMSVTFGQTVWVDDIGKASEGTLIGEAMYDAKRAIIEDVFGEFRPLIIEMRSALHDIDTDRLRRLLAELEHLMFVDGM